LSRNFYSPRTFATSPSRLIRMTVLVVMVTSCARVAELREASTTATVVASKAETPTAVRDALPSATVSTVLPPTAQASPREAMAVTPDDVPPQLTVTASRSTDASTPVRPEPSATPLADCTVSKIDQLRAGGTISFPGYTASTIKDGAGVYQLHVTNSDGSPGPCLTCSAKPGGPPVDRNKMVPYVEPTGNWVLFTAEWARHAPYTGEEWQKYLELANGWFEDLWAMSIDGQRFYQLTNYAATDRFAGIVSARVSKDGATIIWSKLVARPDQIHPHGYFRMFRADFLGGPDRTPKLTNARDITDPKGTWYEPEDFSPDSSRFAFVSNIESSDTGGDIWELNLATGALTNLTKTPNKWDEHARFSPSGKKIAWMSSYPYDISPLTSLTTQTELMIMNADGSGVEQLTHFNTPGHVEYNPERNAAGTPQWSKDGTQVIINDLFLGRSYPDRRWFKVTFAGPCGG
jgi:hypothetical protein